jgi:predicted anti-sigma-YlaC factor YlaD
MANKCADYLKDLNDYLDGTIDPGLCREIEEHVGHCQNCRIMVDTMKRTVVLCRDGIDENLPEALERKLNGVLKARWEQRFKKNN